MFNKLTMLIILFFIVSIPVIVSGQEFKTHPDDKFYENSYTIQGKVKILNHPKLGEIIGDNQFLFFQRVGCKKCVFGIVTDEDGNYMITVLKGKYKVIVREVRGGYAPSFDLLAPSQPRIIDATKSPGIGKPIEFNIMIRIPED